MPDQSSAAQEHALLQDITEPLTQIPDDAVQHVAEAHFPTVLRGYDKFAVDDYVRETSQLVAELQSRSSPQSAVRRALERVGEDVSGILQRAHDTAESITAQSRREAEDRLQIARQEAEQILTDAQERVKELDTDTDRIWAERDRIVGDARELARQLLELANAAAARFPAAEPEPALAVGPVDGEATEPFVPLTELDGGHAPAPAAGDAGDPPPFGPFAADGEPDESDETQVLRLSPPRQVPPHPLD
jgi:cell division septum initiation protein DivIVA